MSQQINLFNPVFLKRNKLFSALAMAQALGLVVLCIAALFAFSMYRSNQLRLDAAEAASRLALMQKQFAEVVERSKPIEKDPALDGELALAESRLGASQRVLDFVRQGDFGSAQGYAEYFRALSRRSTPGVWLTGFSLDDGGRTMEIEGRSLQPALVPAYISGLKGEAVFQGKSFGSMALRAPAKVGAPGASAEAAPTLEYVEFSLRSSDLVNGGVGSMEARVK